MKPDFTPVPNAALPIFLASHDGQALYYTPGCLVGVREEFKEKFDLYLAQPERLDLSESDRSSFRRAARTLSKIAIKVKYAWQAYLSKPFTPLCLTLYPHNMCNLACGYCYSGATPTRHGSMLSLQAVRSAAHIVAKNCRSLDQRMTVVFHGGGEPTLYQDWLEHALDVVETVASQYELDLFRYIATNGVMPAQKAEWLAEHFDMIGLSCDGPADIQSSQRPAHNGQSSSPSVEQTARIIHEQGTPLSVRVTVTPASLHRQSEIASYLCEMIQPQEIHVEPVYNGSAGTKNRFDPEDADAFVDEFFKARLVSRSHGIPWRTSGSRPHELHGPYCQLFRSVLQLVPGDCATTCFKDCDKSQARHNTSLIGAYNTAKDKLQLPRLQIDQLQEELAIIPECCSACFNRFHCSRSCPDHCTLTDIHPAGGFRCRVNSQIASNILYEQASQARDGHTMWLRKLNRPL